MRTAGLFALGAIFGLRVLETYADIICTTPQTKLLASSQQARSIPHKATYGEICNIRSEVVGFPNSVVTRRSGPLVFTITRQSSTEALDAQACETYLEDITQRCVSGGTAYANGIKYEVYLKPEDHSVQALGEGVGSVSLDAQTETEPESQSLARRRGKSRKSKSTKKPKSKKQKTKKQKTKKQKSKKAKSKNGQKQPTSCKFTPGKKSSGGRKIIRDVLSSFIPGLTRRAESGDFNDETQPKWMGIFRRATYTKADATNPAKVSQWLTENETRLKGEGITKQKTVFFASGSDSAGKRMAKDFVSANTEYAMYDDIFMRSAYNRDFKGANPEKGANAQAASEAFARWARNPIVFNADNATPESYWLEHELPKMYDAGTITKMKASALKPEDTDGTIPTPARPVGC